MIRIKRSKTRKNFNNFFEFILFLTWWIKYVNINQLLVIPIQAYGFLIEMTDGLIIDFVFIFSFKMQKNQSWRAKLDNFSKLIF